MAKSGKQLDREIAKAMRLPHYEERRGWTGGDSKTLYAFTDRRTGRLYAVRPGSGGRGKLTDAGGPEADVRVATRAEAERMWQSPLHAGWKVS